jgi:hypothetical protein
MIDLEDSSSSSSSSSLTEKFQRKEKPGTKHDQKNQKNTSGNLLDDENFFSKKPK